MKTKTIMILLIAMIATSCAPKIGDKSKDLHIKVTTQRGVTDTFGVNACRVWLNDGDVMYQNDTDYYFGNYTVLASGIYTFNTY